MKTKKTIHAIKDQSMKKQKTVKTKNKIKQK